MRDIYAKFNFVRIQSDLKFVEILNMVLSLVGVSVLSLAKHQLGMGIRVAFLSEVLVVDLCPAIAIPTLGGLLSKLRWSAFVPALLHPWPFS